nr:MAG TPA: hypothetical protein [Caudoviricetes sp.]
MSGLDYPEIRLNLGKAVLYKEKKYILLGKRVLKQENPFLPARFELVLFNKERQSALFAPMEEVEPAVKMFGWRSMAEDAEAAVQEEIKKG